MKTWGPEARRNLLHDPREPCFLPPDPGSAVTAQNGTALGESRVSHGGMSWGTRDGLGGRWREDPGQTPQLQAGGGGRTAGREGVPLRARPSWWHVLRPMPSGALQSEPANTVAASHGPAQRLSGRVGFHGQRTGVGAPWGPRCLGQLCPV